MLDPALVALFHLPLRHADVQFGIHPRLYSQVERPYGSFLHHRFLPRSLLAHFFSPTKARSAAARIAASTTAQSAGRYSFSLSGPNLLFVTRLGSPRHCR